MIQGLGENYFDTAKSLLKLIRLAALGLILVIIGLAYKLDKSNDENKALKAEIIELKIRQQLPEPEQPTE